MNSSGGPAWANADCHLCKGAGFVHPLHPDGKPNYSAVITCDTCERTAQQYYRSSDNALIEARIDPSKVFANFMETEANKEVLAAARRFGDNPNKLPLLLIFGTTGNGKTHLCQAIAILCHRKGIMYKMTTVADLLAEMRRRIPLNTLEDYMGIIRKWKVLILDDLQSEHLTDWAIARLQEIIDYRYRECERGYPLPTILTTNLAISAVPARIVSRFSEQGLGQKVMNKDIDRRRSPVTVKSV
jgi:DNA replication protein DnaC